MIVPVHCPNPDCRKEYKVDKGRLGRRTTCAGCGREFTLRASEEETLHPDAQTGTMGGGLASPGGNIPAKLGRFEIRCRLGAGAFATVYRAYDPVLDREVALKVPRAAALEKPEARARFLREAKAAAQLRHPHIVPVFDAGSDAEQYYIASAYIEGRTLEEAIDDKRPEFRRAAGIVRDVAGAVEYAHRAGVVHRDVKPANIMIDGSGQAMLTDFGLARLEGSEEKLTQDGTLMGTPAYMAPEQADRSSGEVGPASDQYGLAVVLYELLCGRPPFSGPAPALIYNVLHETPDPPRSIDSAIPRDLETICLKAMAKRPAERYADCGELAEDLRLWLADEPIRARRMGPAERLVRWGRRNPLIGSLLAAVVLVTILGLAGVAWQWRRAEVNRGLAEARRNQAEGLVGQLQNEMHDKRKALTDAKTKGQQLQKLADQLEREVAEKQAALTDAKAKRKKAKDLADQLEEEIREKEENLAQLQQQTKLLQERERALRRQLYVIHVRQAMQAFYAGNVDLARDLLLLDIPASGEADVRCFEWHHLWRRCRATVFEGSLDYPAATSRLAVGPRGRTLALNGRVFFDVATGQRHSAVIPGNTGAFSPDGRIFACCADGKTIRLIHIGTGKESAPFVSQEKKNLAVSGLIFSPDGRTLASIARPSGPPKDPLDGLFDWSFLGRPTPQEPPSPPLITLWDVATRKPLATFEGTPLSLAAFEGTPHFGAFSPDSKILAWPLGGAITLRDARTGREVGALSGRSAYAVAVSPDGTTLASRAEGGTILLWDLAEFKLLDELKMAGNHRDFGPMVFLPGGRIVVAEYGGSWTFPDRLKRGVGPPPPHRVRLRIPLAGFTVCDVATRSVRQVSVGPDLAYVGFLPNGDILAAARAGENDQKLRLRRVSVLGERFHTLPPHKEGTESVAISPGGTVLASAGRDQFIRLRDISTGRPRLTLKGHKDQVTEVAFLPDGNTLVSAGRDKSIILFDVNTGDKQVLAGPGDVDAVDALAVSHDGKTLASASQGGSIIVWDLATRQTRGTLRGFPGGVCSVGFSPDGKILASGDADGTLILWDLDLHRPRVTLTQHEGRVLCVRFSPDGKTLASATTDGTVKLWDVTDPQQKPHERATLAGHRGAVNCIAFSPDGETLASGSEDSTIRLWDVSLGLERVTFKEPTHPVRLVSFSSDGRVLISSSSNGAIRLWRGR